MDLYWTRRMFFHFSSRQNNGALKLEMTKMTWIISVWKCLTLCFHLRLGAHMVPTPTVPGHLVFFDVKLQQPLWEGNMLVFPIGQTGNRFPETKGRFAKAASCSGILDQLLQGVMKCLKIPSELPFEPFKYRKCGAFAFLTSKRSCTDLAASAGAGHWWTWMASSGSLPWPVTIPQLLSGQMPLHRLGLH